MCKVFIIPNIKDSNRSSAITLIENMAGVMSEDKSHQDGTGYAAVNTKGDLFAERWLDHAEAFDVRSPLTSIDQELLDSYGGFLSKSPKYSSHGTIDLDRIASITLHTRLATSGKGLTNCHPFIENDVSVIHNGVIDNPEAFRTGYSTCDSEAVLTGFNDLQVNESVKRWDKLTNKLTGYYALGVYSRNKRGQRQLDVVRSQSANLIGAFVDGVGLVFTSVEHQLIRGAELSNLKVLSVFDVSRSSVVRIDPLTGKVHETASFTEGVKQIKPYTSWESTRDNAIVSKVDMSYDDSAWNRDWYESYNKQKKSGGNANKNSRR